MSKFWLIVAAVAAWLWYIAPASVAQDRTVLQQNAGGGRHRASLVPTTGDVARAWARNAPRSALLPRLGDVTGYPGPAAQGGQGEWHG